MVIEDGSVKCVNTRPNGDGDQWSKNIPQGFHDLPGFIRLDQG